MHDAAEAYLSDVGGPIKHRFHVQLADVFLPFADVEDRLLDVIAGALGFPPVRYEDIRHADLTLLATEARDLLAVDATGWGVPQPPLAEPIVSWPWQQAKSEFLHLFAILQPRIPITLHAS
jgi:hypothetical protein